MKRSKHYLLIALLIPASIAILANLPGCSKAEIKPTECPFEGLECPNALQFIRAYQVQLTGDSGQIVRVYDLNRIVGEYTTNFNNLSPLDSIIFLDNQ